MKKTLMAAALAAVTMAALHAGNESELPAPLDLRSALAYALVHNYSIRQAREQIRQLEGTVIETTAPAIPNVSATGAYQRNDPAISQSYPENNRFYQGAVKATQTVFNAGVIPAIRAARVTREAAQAQLQTAIDAALLDVRTRFYTVLLDDEKVRVQEDNIRLYERQLADTRSQLQAGSVSNFELLRAQVSLANVQPDLIAARNDYRVAQQQLRESLGLPSGPEGDAINLSKLDGTLDVVPESFDEDEALASARSHRPELVNLAKIREAQEDAVSNAKSNYYPNASVMGEYEWNGFGFTGPGSDMTGIPSQANGWLVGVEANWAIFDGRATEGRVREVRSQLEQARLAEDQEQLYIDVEVRQDYSQYVQAQELVGATRQTTGQAQEALRLANDRFHVGSATQLDVLTSQVALTQARTNELQADYNYIIALATLRQAMGLGDALVGG